MCLKRGNYISDYCYHQNPSLSTRLLAIHSPYSPSQPRSQTPVTSPCFPYVVITLITLFWNVAQTEEIWIKEVQWSIFGEIRLKSLESRGNSVSIVWYSFSIKTKTDWRVSGEVKSSKSMLILKRNTITFLRMRKSLILEQRGLRIQRYGNWHRAFTNPFASSSINFGFALKLLRIRDQWYTVLVKCQFVCNRVLSVLTLMPSDETSSGRKCYGAGRRRLSFGSFQKGLENQESTEK